MLNGIDEKRFNMEIEMVAGRIFLLSFDDSVKAEFGQRLITQVCLNRMEFEQRWYNKL